MPNTISESSAITIKVGWLITIVGLLMSLAGSAALLGYQVRELRTQASNLQAQIESMHKDQTSNREAIISLTATLQGQGVLK